MICEPVLTPSAPYVVVPVAFVERASAVTVYDASVAAWLEAHQ